MMEQYLNRNANINEFYNDFIISASAVDEDNPDKYAWLCGWSDKHNQYTRFKKLSEIGIKNGDSVLDIGCGGGEFVQFCKDSKLKVEYTGVDINPLYVKVAQTKYPKNDFLVSNGWDLTEYEFDWAIASGIFTIDANLIYIKWYVGFVMETLVRKGFAFNLLNNNPHAGLINYEPSVVKQELVERFPDYKIEIVTGYLPDDFTVYVTK